MHNYMHARIKFHTYRDIISDWSVTVSRKRELQQIEDYQSYTAYPGNEGFKLHRQSTGGCVHLELNIIFKGLTQYDYHVHEERGDWQVGLVTSKRGKRVTGWLRCRGREQETMDAWIDWDWFVLMDRIRVTKRTCRPRQIELGLEFWATVPIVGWARADGTSSEQYWKRVTWHCLRYNLIRKKD